MNSAEIVEKIFSFFHKLVFGKLGGKFRLKSLKKFIDFSYIFFEMVGCHFDVLFSVYSKLYEDLVEKEIEVAGLSDEDKVLFIGCGSMPVTAVLLSEKTGCAVVAVDWDSKAVKNAAKYLKSSRLEDHVKLVYADGATYPVDDFDLVFLSYGVVNKELVLKNVAEKMRGNTKLMFRTSTESKELIDIVRKNLSKYFEVKNSVRSNRIPQEVSYLLIKK